MARTKPKTRSGPSNGPSPAASASAPAPSSSRPLNGLWVFVFLAAGVLTLWLMRVEPVLDGVPVGFQEQVEAARLDDGTPLVTRFTGYAPVDELLRTLTLAFLPGTAGRDPSVRLEQAHFLLNLFGAICVWTVEAYRQRNAWRLISFTAAIGLLYQVVGSAIVLPFYYASHLWASSSSAYYASGRAVPLPRARAILLCAVLGYLVPTVAMYLPWGSLATTQYLTAFWQPSPAFVNALLFAVAPALSLFPSAGAQTTARNADVKHLKRVYLVGGVVSALAHVGTIYLSLYPSQFLLLTSSTSAPGSSPLPSLYSVFIPDRSVRKASVTAGLHYIFQVDEWGLFVPSLLWCWVAASDVLRLLPRKGGSRVLRLFGAAVAIAGLAVVAGPGAAMAAVWSWREDKLVLIEEAAARRKNA